MIDFKKELNEEQLAVVENGDGPCLVLAGAGSGKTRTITYRVAYLLEQGIEPEEILLVTFTNKAAEEMKLRVAKLTNELRTANSELRTGLPWSGTFHHIAYRILKVYAPLLGYQNNFTILDSDDSESILKLCIKEFKPNTESGQRFPSPSVIHSIISFARNAELTIDAVLEDRFYQWVQYSEEIKSIAHKYTQRKKEANSMDFDDLLTNFLLLLNDERTRTKYATQFKYVLVDEYQDTNKIQASIIRRLASVHGNVVVVGDDAQSIYSFRAADIQNILQFPNQYPGAKIFKLETNYRSTKDILELANDVIANNREQYKKHLKAAQAEHVKPELWPQMDQQSEGNFIAAKIEELLDKGTPAREIAVLFRASHHSQMLEVELVRRGIAYDYRGGVRFFERAHIKDILAYLRILNNLADTAAWLRVLMHEEGIGPAAAQKLIEAIRRYSPLEGGGEGGVGKNNEHPPEPPSKGDSPNITHIGREILGAKAAAGWQHFVAIWNTMVETPNRAPTFLIDALSQSGYREYLESEYVDSRDRLQDIKQLALFAEQYDSLETFLADATLQESYRTIANSPLEGGEEGVGQGPNSEHPPKPPSKGDAKIVLSTIHQAKGLEWETVFIINLSSGSFPSDRSLKEANGLEEERRLFYVAITRAKKHLFLTYPMAGGAFGDFLAGPSSFLNEISPGLLDDHSLLSTDTTILNDPGAGISYVSEDDEPQSYLTKKPKPGSFLKDIEDL